MKKLSESKDILRSPNMSSLSYQMIKDHIDIEEEYAEELTEEVRKIKAHAKKMKRFRSGLDDRSTGLTPEKEKRCKKRREELADQARQTSGRKIALESQQASPTVVNRV
jgi:predicted secreted Zn-dependent protease